MPQGGPVNAVSRPARTISKLRRAPWLLILLLSHGPCLAQPGPSCEYRPDRILIRPRSARAAGSLENFHAAHGVRVVQRLERLGDIEILCLPANASVADFVSKYERSGLVEFAEPDYLVHANLAPDDPYYVNGTLWGLNNTGQSGADIDAPDGWDVLTSASNIVVAVLDTGIRASHEDLQANMWTNPVDGGNGFNAFTGSSDSGDDNGHGTLVSGVLGAVGNNGRGVSGVAWRLQIMSCKCLNSYAGGSESTVLQCINYAVSHGARIINTSFESSGLSLSVSNAIYSARRAGVIFVASAGNNGLNLDAAPRYPACYPIDNVVSVAATTPQDALCSWSNYGPTNVDLAAPGDSIYSTCYLGDSFYRGPVSGTSLAAPYVAGTLALMLAKYPAENYRQIIGRLLAGTDPLPSLAGKCRSGGRLNLRKALSPPLTLAPLPAAPGTPFQLRLSAGPRRTCLIQVSTNLADWTAVCTNTTGDDGTFDFIDAGGRPAGRCFYRAASEL